MSDDTADLRVPRLAIGCRVRTLSPQETMLLVPEGALRLKGAASKIISLIDGQRTVDAITVHLQETHTPDCADQVASDVKQFVEKLHARSVLLFRD
jgi:pyrroloquinoline quinone biosynthesis protein D